MLLKCGVGEDSWESLARRSNQSILKEVSPEYSLEGLMLKLKLQYFGYVMWRTDSKRPCWWEKLKVGGEGDDREWDSWMASLTQWPWPWVFLGLWWWIGKPGVLPSMRQQRVGHNWTELNSHKCGIALWLKKLVLIPESFVFLQVFAELVGLNWIELSGFNWI